MNGQAVPTADPRTQGKHSIDHREARRIAPGAFGRGSVWPKFILPFRFDQNSFCHSEPGGMPGEEPAVRRRL